MKKYIETEEMLSYLQNLLDEFEKEKEQFGFEERGVKQMFHDMIACKEMVEALIGLPVNLQKDGKVTVGL